MHTSITYDLMMLIKPKVSKKNLFSKSKLEILFFILIHLQHFAVFFYIEAFFKSHRFFFTYNIFINLFFSFFK